MIDETAAEIASMQTHSSSSVAVAAAQALATLCDREYETVGAFERDLDHNAGVLRRANPSHATLETALRDIEAAIEATAYETVEDAQTALTEAIETTVDRITTAKDTAATAAAAHLHDAQTVLTHDYSTTVLRALETATADGASVTVYATEARPRYLGRKFAREASTIDGVDVRLIVDSAVGHALDAVDLVLTGMTCIVGDTLYNRVGTYPIAATAADAAVPMAVVGAKTKVLSDGFVFENDFRNETEILREPADGFQIKNPAYDATPVALLDHVITGEA